MANFNQDEEIPKFKPKARLLLQLGDQLIRSESIAVLEIIKNAYDACASKVSIQMKNVSDPQFGEIVIEDDGWGMDINLIKDVWLQPGTTYKKKQVEDENFISPCNRVLLPWFVSLSWSFFPVSSSSHT